MPHKLKARVIAVMILFACGGLARSQESALSPEVPEKFQLDLETAARLRPQLIAQSVPATGRYAAGRLVFERLLEQVPAGVRPKFAWELRLVDDGQFNAYSSPDGTVYVETGLAHLAAASTGMWAAILSHEIAHVIRRDWARRYLYQTSLETSGATIVLGDPGLPAVSWTNAQKASGDLGRFCRLLEIEADRDGLILMARAGYHPDFVPALHHLLHAQNSGAAPASLYALHPCWEERDRELSRAYTAASIEFELRWPAWYASPGGNPPVVVFAETPTVKKTGSKEWEIRIPMRCQNLAGAVEVVLSSANRKTIAPAELPADSPDSDSEFHQLTGCTSPRTTITFTLANPSRRIPTWTDVYVLDAWGTVLARAEVPKPPR